MTEIFTAKTVTEAKELACRKFGKKSNEIKFEVIEEGKRGFLGIGQIDAKVKATYIQPVTKTETPAVKPVVKKTAPAKLEVKNEKPKVETLEKPEVKSEEPKAETLEKSEVKSEESKAETPEKPEVKSKEPRVEAEKVINENADVSIDDFSLIQDENLLHTKVKIAIDYITSVLKAMNINAEFSVYQNETGAIIDIKSDNNGTVIGRRGETLDSIQYLCSIIVNKGDKDYFRITIDCLNYRSKRKETLEQLAVKVAKSVIRSGKSQQLEPMNPYERRVIHSAISEIEGVSSRSVGEEPYRKIIISSLNPKNNKKKNHRDDKKGNRKNERRSHEPFEAKAIDLSTSFEKDYKKPKPEDSMEGGLYGKIEF
ncbi:MAG: Jag N-terminal domain-containing protein [Ruminococcus sp.]|nr:Jag N-terminal domain-containing protein [Ruminococcus sp.]